MTVAQAQNAIVLVELADSEALIQRHGKTLYELTLYPEFVARVRAVTRAGDATKSLGANRLMVVFNAITEAELTLAINKLQRAFAQPVEALDEQVLLAIHAGLAFVEPGAKTADVIREAGISLAKAKAGSRSAPAPAAEGPGEAMLRAVRQALELGEFQLYFQPKFHARFRSLLGAEALLRWHTREKQVLVPAKFIGAVENSDLMLPLMEWVVKSAIARLRRWPKNFAIAVNIPVGVLQRPELAIIVADALSLYGIDASRLLLEVDEKLIIDDPDKALRVFQRLRELGVRVSINDFGSDHFKAYKGLTQLVRGQREAPVDEIKIDRRLVGNLPRSAVNGDMVLNIINLAHGAKIKVVGVGVEDEPTAKALADMGCDELQGFGLGMPLPLDEFESRFNIKNRAFK